MALLPAPMLTMPPFDFEQMKRRCLAPFEDFEKEGDLYEVDFGAVAKPPTGRRFIWRNTGAKVLAVAHLDTVQSWTHFHHIEVATVDYVVNAQLDDRLGAYLILDYLPQILGENAYDILLTEGEESSCSTASWFHEVQRGYYHWIFEMDRGGTDVVGYQYDRDVAWEKLVEEADWKSGRGSYSDIADLEHLGVLGFNFGCGYHQAHEAWANAPVWQIRKGAEGVVRFYNLFKDTPLPYVPSKHAQTAIVYSSHHNGYWDGDINRSKNPKASGGQNSAAANTSSASVEDSADDELTSQLALATDNDVCQICLEGVAGLRNGICEACLLFLDAFPASDLLNGQTGQVVEGDLIDKELGAIDVNCRLCKGLFTTFDGDPDTICDDCLSEAEDAGFLCGKCRVCSKWTFLDSAHLCHSCGTNTLMWEGAYG